VASRCSNLPKKRSKPNPVCYPSKTA
jgi:hypothetical protein